MAVSEGDEQKNTSFVTDVQFTLEKSSERKILLHLLGAKC